MAAINPEVYAHVADFLRGAVRNIFDSRFDWTPDADSILVTMRDGGMTEEQEQRFRPYFDLFVDQCRRGIASGFSPPSDDESFEEYPPRFDLERLLADPLRPGEQGDLFGRPEMDGHDPDRALIDQLIADTQLYSNSGALKELFDFTARLRYMAPFNAMLLHAQKPGISHAMTVQDWWTRFRRRPKEGARPLVILRNFGPVNFVYDVLDTEGDDLPEAAFSFPTAGKLPSRFLRACEQAMAEEDLRLIWLDKGDRSAGFARRITDHGDPKMLQTFEVGVNRNHPEPTQVVTLVHELAHIFLGHCGTDFARRIKPYRPADLALREIEAESVAYVVAKRSGLAPRSESYLDTYKGAFEALDVHRVLTCAHRIEKLLGMPFEDGGLTG
ncbi:protein of unknown function [Ruegeria intermedia]|uniref:IrrE N-terminal-like domain-containing protein n=1 Tax=Ruegeria intermedia TaxID=996115 RepID=A0A1M4Y5I5_9RHOB|nr:ImmA/IrrE family metallo-endopeptidase [Ruegeria intermedia]SHF01087.1 protein of unknown function [Ruegeria intermedia]